MRSLAILVLVVAAVASPIAARSSQRASGESGLVLSEKWTTLDAVAGVGKVEWSCVSAEAKVRFMAGQGATERVSVRTGSVTRSRALLQRGYALALPFRRSQTWIIERLSESLPPTVVIRVRSKGGQGCQPPKVEDHTRG